MLEEFERDLNSLRDHPDRAVIERLTSHAQSMPHLSLSITKLIIAKLIDKSTPITFQLPIFYLVDSLLKYVRQPYIRTFSDEFDRDLDLLLREIPPSEIKHFDFLFTTWIERTQSNEFLPKHLLLRMKDRLKQPLPLPHPTDRSTILTIDPILLARMELILDTVFTKQLNGIGSRPSLETLRQFDPALFANIQAQAQASFDRLPPPSVPVISPPVLSPPFPTRSIDALVSGSHVPLDIDQLFGLCQRMDDASQTLRAPIPSPSSAPSPLNSASLSLALSTTSQRLQEYLRLKDVKFRLPVIFSTEPAVETPTVTPSISARPRVSTVPFKILDRRPDLSIRDLFQGTLINGVRWRTREEAMEWTKTQPSTGTEGRKFRQWFPSWRKWCGELDSLPPSAQPLPETSRSFVVPAHDDFPCCPISGDKFEKVWDEELGENMYRDAVKLLVRSNNPEYFQKGKETSSRSPDVRFLIVAKLCLDGWLASGKAASFRETCKKLVSEGRADISDKLREALTDEDEDVTFVLVENIDQL